MVKTTVYLEEAEAAALRRLAARTSRSQAEIIREAVSKVTAAAGPRCFASVGAGHGSGQPVAENADALIREELGRRHR
jgi:hypothetical protein